MVNILLYLRHLSECYRVIHHYCTDYHDLRQKWWNANGLANSTNFQQGVHGFVEVLNDWYSHKHCLLISYCWSELVEHGLRSSAFFLFDRITVYGLWNLQIRAGLLLHCKSSSSAVTRCGENHLIYCTFRYV